MTPKRKVDAPRKRRGGASGANAQPQRQLRAPPALWALVDRAIAASGLSWSEWARKALTQAAGPER